MKDGKRKRGMKEEEEEDGGTKKQPLFLEVGPKVGWTGPRAKRKRNILPPAQKPKILKRGASKTPEICHSKWSSFNSRENVRIWRIL